MGSAIETGSELVDADSFSARLAQFGWIVSSLASKLSKGDDNLLDELEQVGRIELWRACEAYQPGKQAMATYAYTRIRGQMLNVLEKEFREERGSTSLDNVVGFDAGDPITLGDTIEDLSPNAEERMLEDERDHAIHRAIQSLSARDRMIVQMRFFDDFGGEEIAQALGIGETAVRKYLAQALKHLRPLLEREIK